MAELVVPPPNKKSPGNAERPEEKASTSLLSRGLKPLVLLSLLAIMMLKQDTVMISKYRHALDMDEDQNSSDNDVVAAAATATFHNSSDNDVVVVAAAVAVGNHNSSSQNEPNENSRYNDVVAAAVAAVAVGNHNSSSQKEQNETPSRGSLGSASVSASTTFRLPSSEWLEDIDTESLLGCGNFKCAFSSRTTSRGDGRSSSSSGSSNDPDRYRYGYLVMTKYPHGERTFALAQELSDTFAVKHALLANPLTFGIGETNKSFVVQPIKLYSKDSLLFKCNREKNSTNPFEWAKTLQFHSALVDPIVFQERLRSDFNKTTKLMMDSKYSQCLAHDAQLVIDSITGSIIQIDIDRCFMTIRSKQKRRKKMKKIPACLQEVETITESMIARKKYLYSTIDSTGSNHQNKTVGKRDRPPGVLFYSPLKHIDMIDMARNRGN